MCERGCCTLGLRGLGYWYRLFTLHYYIIFKSILHQNISIILTIVHYLHQRLDQDQSESFTLIFNLNSH